MTGLRSRARRVLALSTWAFAVWVLITWTATAEQLVTGGIVALATAVALSPFGDVVPPWRLLEPRRLILVLRLGIKALGRIAVANARLAARIWSPRRPLHSGMVVVPTRARTGGALAATGLISSLIVDNQIVDLDRSAHELQYHAVDVPAGTGAEKAKHINEPVERLIVPLTEVR